MTKDEKRRLTELKEWVSICFTASPFDNHQQIADVTGLHISTIRRLWWGEFTLNVRFGTIQLLAEAVGLRLIIGGEHIRAEVLKTPRRHLLKR